MNIVLIFASPNIHIICHITNIKRSIIICPTNLKITRPILSLFLHHIVYCIALMKIGKIR